MKGMMVVGLTVVVVLMALYEWPRMDSAMKKERLAFAGLTAIGWLLGVLLVFFPDMPGPAQLFDTLFKPLGQVLGK